MKNMGLSAICEACHGVLHGPEAGDAEAKGVVIDSRLVEKDFVFIATKGEKVDGHSFIDQVFEKGALAVVCEKLPEKLTGPCILVEDSFVALKEIAKYYRSQLDIPVIGITGSVGKTTTKEFVASVLSRKYKVWFTQGNFNNEVGMPLTILQTREEHEVLVLEMGINHFGEMNRLSAIARPDIMLITNIGQCHLEFLGDRDGVFRAKTECFENLNKNACVILNGDDDKLIKVKEVQGKAPLFFGKEERFDYHVSKKENKGLFGTEAVLESKVSGETIECNIPLPGAHMVNNALAAMAVGEALGLTPDEIEQGIENVPSTKGRSNILSTENYTIIDDCYNANPTSMKAALDLLSLSTGRKVAIMGDMFELGEDEIKLHRETGEYAVKAGIDVIICVGGLSKASYEGTEEAKGERYYFETLDSFLDNMKDILKKNDTILVKASHSMGFESIVKTLQN